MLQSALIDWRSLTALALEWAVIVLSIGLATTLGGGWAMTIAFVVVATRQHALLILYHDAVHGHFARDQHLNDCVVNLFVGVPALMPVELYRPLHIEHHQELGTERDPERQLLYAKQAWNYRPLPATALARQLAGDLLLVNGIRTLIAWRRLRPLPRIPRPTVVIAALWLAAVGLWAIVDARAALVGLALWFGPLLTLTQLWQKLRSYAEHSGGPGVTPNWPDWTYSWRPGTIGRMTIWPYNINLHREHHQQPALPWHRLADATDSGPQLPGGALWDLLAARADGSASH